MVYQSKISVHENRSTARPTWIRVWVIKKLRETQSSIYALYFFAWPDLNDLGIVGKSKIDIT